LGEKYDVVIYLTQDALLEPFAIETVLKLFELNQTAGIVYGRQIPHVDANPLAAHARIYNYPDKDCFKDKSKIREYGIKTVFISNSFAAYRIEALKRVNYFPIHTILCEDMFVASKVIELGGSIIYSSKAIVRHSHNYTIFQEFSRYFDIGVFHSKESWIRKEFGGAGSEGVKYLISELKYLLANGNYCWIVVSILANFFKLMGMFIGKRYALLSDSLIKKLSMHKGYWEF
jgi:rhamnosyltransferase